MTRILDRVEYKTILGGSVWIVVAVWFVFYYLGNPIHELRLILYAKSVPGKVIETWEEFDGEYGWSCGAIYTFRPPGGIKIKSFSSTCDNLSFSPVSPDDPDDLGPIGIEVEYIPANPTINRIKGTGVQSLIDFLLRKVVLGSILLVMLVWPGFILVRDSVKNTPSIRSKQQ